MSWIDVLAYVQFLLTGIFTGLLAVWIVFMVYYSFFGDRE